MEQGSICPCASLQQCSKKRLKNWRLDKKQGFRAHSQKGVGKMGQNATWSSGVRLKRGGQKNSRGVRWEGGSRGGVVGAEVQGRGRSGQKNRLGPKRPGQKLNWPKWAISGPRTPGGGEGGQLIPITPDILSSEKGQCKQSVNKSVEPPESVCTWEVGGRSCPAIVAL